LACAKVQRVIVVTWTSVLASHFKKKLRQSFYVICKTLQASYPVQRHIFFDGWHICFASMD
ncbi:MAG: hypothetical protein AB2693_32260, partial [Candidatus Thiodiazotropha sp.]